MDRLFSGSEKRQKVKTLLLEELEEDNQKVEMIEMQDSGEEEEVEDTLTEPVSNNRVMEEFSRNYRIVRVTGGQWV